MNVNTHYRLRRATAPAILTVGGAALTLAVWAGGSGSWAISAAIFYAIAALVAWKWAGGRGEIAALLRADGDERLRSIDRDATATTGAVMAAAAIIGAVVEAAAHHGDPGAYGLMCLLGGITYTMAVVLLRRRR
jgi:uncharacterized membrane protein